MGEWVCVAAGRKLVGGVWGGGGGGHANLSWQGLDSQVGVMVTGGKKGGMALWSGGGK